MVNKELRSPFIEDLHALAKHFPPSPTPWQRPVPSMGANSVSDTPVVLVGSPDDIHVRAVYEGVCARGHDPFVLDTRRFAEGVSISLGSMTGDIVIDGHRVSRPAAVYLRMCYRTPLVFGPEIEDAMRDDWRGALMAFRERSAIISGVLLRWEAQGIPFYNSFSVEHSTTKPLQLARLQQAGLPVPATLWSNDPDDVVRFCSEHQAIYKPVVGGAPTRRVRSRDLEPERLARIRMHPVCFQELLPGHDVRVYVLDGRVLCAMRIRTDEIDFRLGHQSIETIELPDDVKDLCVRAADVLGLRYTGMDIKGDREGNYRILELNSSAMFLGFEARAGVRVLDPLCDALVSHIPP